MKIAIHHSKQPDFSKRWIAYCSEKNIQYKLVNCYEDDIITTIQDCEALLWHHNHANPTDVLIAKEILFAIENSGKKVFPNFYTGWHFDDKVAQKYLLESLNIPMVRSYTFYNKKDALVWASNSNFPKVFKLRRGAGSRNVKLVSNRNQAKYLINKAFGRGFRQFDPIEGIKEAVRKFRLKKIPFKEVIKAFAHLVYPIWLEKSLGRERGYVYFQDFIPNNEYDIRVIVVKDKAFAIKRNIRKNDFRASGSGFIEYEKKYFSDDLIGLSFNIAEKTKSNCLAIDYVFNDEEPLVVEISYGFSTKGYDDCAGYWDKELNWYEGAFNPYGWMIENVIFEKK